MVRGDFRSRICEASSRSLLSCSAAAVTESACLLNSRRWWTKRVTMVSTRADSEVVISDLSTSARPSRSVPDIRIIELLLLLRSIWNFSDSSDLRALWAAAPPIRVGRRAGAGWCI